jgi:hypothetical protein
MNVPADFSCEPALQGSLRYTHRRTEDGLELYFVANKIDAVVQGTCVFRAAAGPPEMWWPQTGRSEPVAVYEPVGSVTRVPMRLEPHESVFVVFRPGQAILDPATSVTRDGRNIHSPLPVAGKVAVQKAVYGVVGDPTRTRDVTAKVQAIVDGGQRRFAAWRLGEGDDPGMQLLKSLSIEYTLDGIPRKSVSLDGHIVCLNDTTDAEPTAHVCPADNGNLLLEAWQNGSYEIKTASGRTLRCQVDNLPAVLQIGGPWDVSFPVQTGAPGNVTLDQLISWSDHPDLDVKYFSGTATYRNAFRVPPDMLAAGRAAYLDFGKVAVIAQVRLNGKDLGILWKTPFRVEATAGLQTGENILEVQVTNLWVNRMIGDEQMPEDSTRTPEGLLTSWPSWLIEGKPSPVGRHTFATYRVWRRDSPLQVSGLLGPVKLYTTQRVIAR